MTDFAELERLAREATPGPWEAYTDCPGECCWLIRQPDQDDAVTEGITWPETSKEDAAYIAACSPEVVLRLLSIARAAESLIASEKDFGWPPFAEKLAALREALSPLTETTKEPQVSKAERMTSDLSNRIDRALDAGLADATALKLRYRSAPPDCPACGGVGEREVFRGDLGPDSYSELMPCPDCKGTGNDPRPAKCCAGERGPHVAQKCVTCPYGTP